MHEPVQANSTRMIALDMDGTLLDEDGKVSPRNLAALLAAEAAGIEIVVATGRRHCYALRVLRPLGLHHDNVLISSNGTVTRTLGSFGPSPIASRLIARTHLPRETALWLCGHVDEFRNALVFTFDRVGPDGEDTRGALVVEDLDELNASIGRWMVANEPYIAHVKPIENALAASDSNDDSNPDSFNQNAPIQAMLCGTIERMARAEARLLEHPGVHASGQPSGRSGATSGSGTPSSAQRGTPSSARLYRDRVGCLPPTNHEPGAPSFPVSSETVGSKKYAPQPVLEPILTLHRTEYPSRDLSILDILPAGCSKGASILSLAAARGIEASQILAIGDNWNDVSMLEIAGAAVLMDNAPEDLKTLALTNGWRIGLTNHEDGVAEAIETVLAATCEPA